MAEEQFLHQMYRESGDQVRNMNALRNTFLTFFIVGIAAFTGLLSQANAPRSVWWIVVAFAAIGIIGIVITWHYIQAALTRQRLITQMLLTPERFREFGFRELDERHIKTRIRTCRWWKGRRLDLFPMIIYLGVGGLAIWFALCGDLFGLAIR